MVEQSSRTFAGRELFIAVSMVRACVRGQLLSMNFARQKGYKLLLGTPPNVTELSTDHPSSRIFVVSSEVNVVHL